MSLKLDHVFIFVSAGAPEAEKLRGFGFLEGEPNTHPGQGTSNRRFFFDNMMLELLWVSDRDEAQSERTRRTRLWERWKGRKKTSPFGLVFTSSDADVPFTGWEYTPHYLPEGLHFLVGDNAEILNEPLVFRMPDKEILTPRKLPAAQNQPGFAEVSSVSVGMSRVSSLSPVMESIKKSGVIGLEEAGHHVLELHFGDGSKGRAKDFFPELPLRIRW